MSEHHLVVGAGPSGRAVAARLVESGERVVVATRSGRDSGVVGAEHIALDAGDGTALERAASGAAALYNAVNPGDYTQWERVWPPIAASMLTAVERTGAVYGIVGNLYPYGPVRDAMHEGLPDAAVDRKGALRARMWAEALAAHDAGRIRAVEVRASDFVGGGIGHVSRVLPAALRGRPARMLGRTDLPHTVTDVHDLARTLVAAVADPSSHGRVWHAPSVEARTQAQVVADVLAVAGRPPVRVRSIGDRTVRMLGLVSPLMRELDELGYQRSAPYVMDSSAARSHFGIEPSAWDETCRRTLAAVPGR